ncbi:hypothetical protein [Geodermatophilus sp. URMC 63]
MIRSTERATIERLTPGRPVTRRPPAARTAPERVGRHAWVRTPRRPLPGPTAEAAVAVGATAVAALPGAVIERLEVDGSGLFEAHLLSADGQVVVVQIDADLTVVGWLAEVG